MIDNYNIDKLIFHVLNQFSTNKSYNYYIKIACGYILSNIIGNDLYEFIYHNNYYETLINLT
jgi:hypothetical protein